MFLRPPHELAIHILLGRHRPFDGANHGKSGLIGYVSFAPPAVFRFVIYHPLKREPIEAVFLLEGFPERLDGHLPHGRIVRIQLPEKRVQPDVFLHEEMIDFVANDMVIEATLPDCVMFPLLGKMDCLSGCCFE